MQVPATQRVNSEFTERNALLHALLGALSFAERCEQTLASESAPFNGHTLVAAPPAMVDALLGLISFNRTLVDEVRACAARNNELPLEPARTAPVSSSTFHTSLLR